jgi:hypothetical protein
MLRDRLIARGYREQSNGDWVKPSSDGEFPTTITYSKGVVVADDAMHRSREETGKRWFNVYTGPVICGPDKPVIEVSVDATEEEIRDAIIEKFGGAVWKVYEVDVTGNHEIRMW